MRDVEDKGEGLAGEKTVHGGSLRLKSWNCSEKIGRALEGFEKWKENEVYKEGSREAT